MKKGKRFLTLLLIGILTFGTLFALTGCDDDESSDVDGMKTKTESITISLKIYFPSTSKQKSYIDNDYVIEKNATPMDVIELYCAVNEISLYEEMNSNTVYGIGDTINTSDISWAFKINDKDTSQGAKDVTLTSGDSLTWYFGEIPNN